MKDRGELGCALILLVALVAGAIFLISQAPWLLLAVPLALVVVILAIVVLADVFSDDVLVTTDAPGGFTARRLAFINGIRRSLKKVPLLQAPKMRVTFEERQMVKQASKAASEIMATLGTSAVPVSDRSQLQQQASEVPQNMVQALWRLDRLRRVKNALDIRTPEGKANRAELDTLDQQVVAEMQRALSSLASTPVNLMKLELAQAERPGERLLTQLTETNQQLRDLSAAYDEIRGKQAGTT